MGVYGKGVHDWILDEALVGARVAHYLDSENNTGWSALWDLIFEEDMRSRATSPRR